MVVNIQDSYTNSQHLRTDWAEHENKNEIVGMEPTNDPMDPIRSEKERVFKFWDIFLEFNQKLVGFPI